MSRSRVVMHLSEMHIQSLAENDVASSMPAFENISAHMLECFVNQIVRVTHFSHFLWISIIICKCNDLIINTTWFTMGIKETFPICYVKIYLMFWVKIREATRRCLFILFISHAACKFWRIIFASWTIIVLPCFYLVLKELFIIGIRELFSVDSKLLQSL